MLLVNDTMLTMQRLIQHDSIAWTNATVTMLISLNPLVDQSIQATFCDVACETFAASVNSTPDSGRSMMEESPGIEHLKSNDTRHKLILAYQATFLLENPLHHKIPKCACKHTPKVQGFVHVRHSTEPEHKRGNSRNRPSENFVPWWTSDLLMINKTNAYDCSAGYLCTLAADTCGVAHAPVDNLKLDAYAADQVTSREKIIYRVKSNLLLVYSIQY